MGEVLILDTRHRTVKLNPVNDRYGITQKMLRNHTARPQINGTWTCLEIVVAVVGHLILATTCFRDVLFMDVQDMAILISCHVKCNLEGRGRLRLKMSCERRQVSQLLEDLVAGCRYKPNWNLNLSCLVNVIALYL